MRRGGVTLAARGSGGSSRAAGVEEARRGAWHGCARGARRTQSEAATAVQWRVRARTLAKVCGDRAAVGAARGSAYGDESRGEGRKLTTVRRD